ASHGICLRLSACLLREEFISASVPPTSPAQADDLFLGHNQGPMRLANQAETPELISLRKLALRHRSDRLHNPICALRHPEFGNLAPRARNLRVRPQHAGHCEYPSRRGRIIAHCLDRPWGLYPGSDAGGRDFAQLPARKWPYWGASLPSNCLE